jgi:FAD/FMN-containing dehydrogenase
MRRRDFCLSALSAGAAASLPGRVWGRAGSIDAITGAGTETSLERAAVNELAESLAGELLLPQDAAYDSARRVWNGMIDRRPALIVQCRTADDVANAVSFAGERNLLLAVKGGGHSFPGKSTCDGGMMIDLSAMHSVDVDVARKTARVDGGALLGHLDGATFTHELATTTGIVSHTGCGGFTLGGGLGRTDRLHGLAVDNVLAASIVTADGRILRASADENPDLFWAIRGGGGNFGVVTEFVYRLHPFNPTVYGGTLVYGFDQARELLCFWAEFNQSLPDEANIEPIWFVGEDGRRMIVVEVVWSGRHDTGEKVLAPLLEFGRRTSGELGPMDYSSFQTKDDAYMGHGKLNYLKSGFVVELGEDAIDAIVGNYEGERLPAGWFQHQGGAMSRIAPADTAFVHREVDLNLGVSSVWTDPAESEQRVAAVRRYHDALRPFMKGYYTNLNEESEQKTRGNFGENHPRLVEIKNRYDPANLFRLNANIRPTH